MDREVKVPGRILKAPENTLSPELLAEELYRLPDRAS